MNSKNSGTYPDGQNYMIQVGRRGTCLRKPRVCSSAPGRYTSSKRAAGLEHGGFDRLHKRLTRAMEKIVFCCLLLIFAFAVPGYCGPDQDVETLAGSVAALHLGMKGYELGRVLNAEQKKIARQHPVKNAYAGTYKFRDDDLFVVVDQGTDRVLALYERKEDVGYDQLKEMVARLMTTFNEPTTMAHDKILYWAFTRNGLLSEDAFTEAKKAKATPLLGVLATVKFNSTMEIVPDQTDGGKKKTTAQADRKGTIYFIITSDPMVQAFMKTHRQQATAPEKE